MSARESGRRECHRRERETSVFFRGYRYALRDQDTTCPAAYEAMRRGMIRLGAIYGMYGMFRMPPEIKGQVRLRGGEKTRKPKHCYIHPFLYQQWGFLWSILSPPWSMR